jgi:uncharacterized membrane protein
MAKMEKSILVHAPVDKVWSYMDEPTNLPAIWPSLVEARDVQRLPNGGKQWRWAFKMAGFRYEGDSEDVEWVANQRVVSKTKGGIDSTFIWTYEPEADGTRVTVEIEYIIPVPVLGRLAESIIVKINENETEVLLANLKAVMEA